MPANGLSIIKKMMDNDFSTYDVRVIEGGNSADGTAKVVYEIHTDDMCIAFYYYDMLATSIAIIDKNTKKKDNVLFKFYTLNHQTYKEVEAFLHGCRDIIHENTYEGMDKKKLVKALQKFKVSFFK